MEEGVVGVMAAAELQGTGKMADRAAFVRVLWKPELLLT